MELRMYKFPKYRLKLKIPYTKHPLSVATLIFPLLLTGCITPTKQSETSQDHQKIAGFETDEYEAQKGLAIIKASTLYARGGTGQGVTVAVIDSGLNTALPEFSGRIADPGYDFMRNVPGTIDVKGHGTEMAGIIAANKDGEGIHGVAYDAQVIPMRFGDNDEPFFFDSQIAQSWKLSFDAGARIISNSWANSIPATEVTEARYKQVMPESLAMARELVSNGAVFVFPTGNELKRQPLAEPGLPFAVSELEKGWLAVVALNNDGTLVNDKSNYCAIAAKWCIAAPGGDGGKDRGLLTTGKDGALTETAGTSPATAMVSGALAAMQSLYPQASPQQLRAILLTSANRNGLFANEEAYGQGVLDLDAAAIEAKQQFAAPADSDS
jgi:subtilisin family serine protease